MKAWGSKRIIRSEELQTSLEALQLEGFTGLLSKHPAFREKALKETAPVQAHVAPEAEPAPTPPAPPPIDYAAELAAKLRAEVEAGRQQGHAEGYAAGHAEGLAAGQASGQEAGYAAGQEAGYAAGLAAGQSQGASEAVYLQTAMGDLSEQLAEFESKMAGPILDIALAVARQVIRTTLQTEPERLVGVIREALDALPDLYQQPRVQLHPDDLALLQQLMPGEIKGGSWRLEADASQHRGGCRLVTGSVEADLTVATRWRRVVETLGRHDDWNEPDLPALPDDDPLQSDET